MKVFGTVDSFVESGEASLKLGRLVANFEFLKALLIYGSFDQYRIFCPSFDNLKLLQSRLEAAITDDAMLSRIVLSHHLNFPDALRDTEFSAFHVGGWSWYLPRLAYLRAKYQARFPLTGVIHSLDTPEVMRDVRELLRSPLAACDSIICTSAPGRQVFRNYVDAVRAQEPELAFPARLDLLPLGVGDECFVRRDRVAARAKLGLGPAGVVLLYMGRMSIYTKADLVPLLYTFLQLRRDEQEPVYLVLAGGTDAANLTNLQMTVQDLGLGDRILLRPNIEDAEKFSLYAAADIFVSPIDSFQETFGISVVEAMAHGLAAVVSDFDGYRDLVEEGVTGYRIPVTWLPPAARIADIRGLSEPALASFYAAQGVALDQEGLLHRLRSLVHDPALRGSLGEAGRALALRQFHWREVIRGYEHVWDELAGVARGLKPSAAAADPNVPDMAQVFAHYPSQIFVETSLLQLTELGQAVRQGRVPLPAVYGELSPLLPGELVDWLFSGLAAQGATLAQLAQRALSELGAEPSLTRSCVAWLVKYGLVAGRSGA